MAEDNVSAYDMYQIVPAVTGKSFVQDNEVASRLFYSQCFFWGVFADVITYGSFSNCLPFTAKKLYRILR